MSLGITRRAAVSLVTILFGALGAAACGGAGSSVPAPAPTGDETPAPSAGSPSGDATGSSPTTTPPPPPGPTVPSGLACLAKYFGGTAQAAPPGAAGGVKWVLHLPDGTDRPWDDGKTKTYDDALADPDLEDTLEIPYTTGPIVPDNTVNLDPGRIRDDVLMKATFGGTSDAVQAKLVDVDFVGQTVKFHTRAAAALGRVSTKLKTLVAATPSLNAFVTGELGGTFDWRPILNTNRMSPHSYGIAIDIVVAKSAYWEWDQADGNFAWNNQIPQAIVDAFESEGFAWGGRWYHYDTMHFEYRPELFDPACKP